MSKNIDLTETVVRHTPRMPKHSPIINHNVHIIIPAEDLRPISANAILWHTRLWWLDHRGSRFHKLRTPSKSLYVRIQVTIAIPYPGAGN